MRMKFREFYFYAIKGILADPIKEGSCPSDCVDEIHCCAFLSAFNINTKEALVQSIFHVKMIGADQ